MLGQAADRHDGAHGRGDRDLTANGTDDASQIGVQRAGVAVGRDIGAAATEAGATPMHHKPIAVRGQPEDLVLVVQRCAGRGRQALGQASGLRDEVVLDLHARREADVVRIDVTEFDGYPVGRELACPVLQQPGLRARLGQMHGALTHRHAVLGGKIAHAVDVVAHHVERFASRGAPDPRDEVGVAVPLRGKHKAGVSTGGARGRKLRINQRYVSTALDEEGGRVGADDPGADHDIVVLGLRRVSRLLPDGHGHRTRLGAVASR